MFTVCKDDLYAQQPIDFDLIRFELSVELAIRINHYERISSTPRAPLFQANKIQLHKAKLRVLKACMELIYKRMSYEDFKKILDDKRNARWDEGIFRSIAQNLVIETMKYYNEYSKRSRPY